MSENIAIYREQSRRKSFFSSGEVIESSRTKKTEEKQSCVFCVCVRTREGSISRYSLHSYRIYSMPRIDVNGIDGRNDKIPSKSGFIKVLNGLLDKSPRNSYQNFEIAPDTSATTTTTTITTTTTDGQYHSPKVFSADSITITVNAKDVLGSKFDNFSRNLMQTIAMPAESTVLTKINGTNGANGTGGHSANGHLVNGVNGNGGLPKLQPLSACYDRYPKPGSYGSLQVFPMNGINSEINNAKENFCDDRPSIDDEITKVEQDRLDEILKMCADFERQNQNVQSHSPIVQNRIKTNGSLPREKKSPLSPDLLGGTTNVFFPPSPGDFRSVNANQPSSPHTPHKTNTGYENVKLFAGRKADLSASSSRFAENKSDLLSPLPLTNGNSTNGYENMMSPIKSPVGYVPQSPRTRIKTCCMSPKKELTSTPIQRKTDYDLLVQSFEEKLRSEIQQLRDTNRCDNQISQDMRQSNQKPEAAPTPPPKPQPPPSQQAIQSQPQSSHHQYANVTANRSANPQEGIYGSLTNRHKNNNHLTVNIKKNLDDKQIDQLKKQQVDVVRKARELKHQIAELQRQEEEVIRDVSVSIDDDDSSSHVLFSRFVFNDQFSHFILQLDLEKTLVLAELKTEQTQLNEMVKHLATLQAKIHRLEAQRNANRVLQETQQNKLKQSIDMKQNQVEG